VRFKFVLAIVLSVVPAPLRGQINNVNQGQLDLSVPDSPAFTVLGVNPTTVTRPTTPQELSSSLINGVDQNGNFQSGIALDFAPYMLAYGSKVGINAYNQGCTLNASEINKCRLSMLRLVARTQVSIGVVKGATSSDKSAKLALGAHLTIFDFGDPRLDRGFLKSLDDAQAQAMAFAIAKRTAAGKSPLPAAGDATGQQDFLNDQNTQLKKLIPPLIDDEKAKNWNRSSWTIAAAPSWSSSDGTTSNMKWNGAGAWTNVGYGFEQVPGLRDISQLIGFFEYRNREAVPATTVDVATLQNSVRGGGRWLFGTNDFHASAESLYVNTRPAIGKEERYVQTTIAGEKRLNNNLWLQLSVGGQSGRINGRNQLFILTSFKWGTSHESQIKAGS
jgi:hypothetical protein